MKILLDERLPLDFRHCFPGHDTHTVQWAGLKSAKNGELLRAAELAALRCVSDCGPRARLTTKSRREKAFIVSIRSKANQMEDLLPLVDAIVQALKAINPSQIVRIG
jgi:hypothetical protein